MGEKGEKEKGRPRFGEGEVGAEGLPFRGVVCGGALEDYLAMSNIILKNTEEQKRKLIWRYVALLSIQIKEIDSKNKSANELLEEVVQFLEKMEPIKWKEHYSFVLRLSKDALRKNPKIVKLILKTL